MSGFVERSGNVERRFDVDSGNGKVHIKRLTHSNKEVNNVWVRSVAFFSAIFLPEGYPNTVSPDYLTYQCYDTLQALCSSVTGTLGTRSILRGVGVGEATATAMSGTVQWITRDGVGMVGRICFATKIASDLDNDAKRWRFAADFTNDVALMLDILSSYLPPEYWLLTVCIAALFRAVTAVAGGATRASLTQHFAVCDNTADVSAKDGSQETGVNLIGMFLGMFIAWVVPETFLPTGAVFLFFTFLHLWSNYWGVRSLLLCHFNEARATICLSSYLNSKVIQSAESKIPTPAQVRNIEPVVGRYIPAASGSGGTVENFNMELTLGASLYEVLTYSVAPYGRDYLESVKKDIESSLSNHGYAVVVHHTRTRFGGLVSRSLNRKNGEKAPPNAVSVILAEGINTEHLLQAWTLARGGVVPGSSHNTCGYRDAFNRPFVVLPTGEFTKFATIFFSRAESCGWKLNRLQLALRDWRVQGVPVDISRINSAVAESSLSHTMSRASTRKSTVGFAGEQHLDLDNGMSPLPMTALTPAPALASSATKRGRQPAGVETPAAANRGAPGSAGQRTSSIRRRGTSFTRD